LKINVKGAIVPNEDKWIYDWLEMDATCPKDVLNSIEKSTDGKLDVYINSGGGDIFAGSEIYAALQGFTGEVVIHVVGLAASAASVIACAGQSDITKTGMFMYHNVSSGARGDYHAMDKASEVLQVANRAISAAYVAKTGMSEKDLLARMDAETWITADDAVSLGFIDKIAESKNLKLSAASGGVLPQETIDKIRNTVKNPLGNEADIFMPAKAAQAKIKLLNLKVREI